MNPKYQTIIDNWDKTYQELSDMTGYSPEYIRKGLRPKLGLPHKVQSLQCKGQEVGSISEESLKKILRNKKMTVEEIADHFGVPPKEVREAITQLDSHHVLLERQGDKITIGKDLITPQEAKVIDFRKHKEVVYPIGFTADNHLGSKYERNDVLNYLFDRFEEAGVDTVYQGGNMIDGEARFNKFDIYAYGVEAQVKNFIEKWPQRKGIKTHFITGDDHEGWYVQREHINIGQKIEDEARRMGRDDLIHLGYMEKDIVYEQAKGQSTIRVIHAGGGSSYAHSYTSQKYVESLQGGEKPQIVLVGHFHKINYGFPREVHVIQMGCTEDQTPFMRKKRIEAHVGGGILWVRQNELGIFTSVKVEYFTCYDKKFYEYKW